MSVIKSIQNDHSRDWHLQRFTEFAAAKFAIGEPVSHMSLIIEMSKGAGEQERLWRAGLYAAAYSVISCEGIWNTWDAAAAGAMPEKILPWLRDNWAGIHTRKERRCVRTPEKFAKCLVSYRIWMDEEYPKLRIESAGLDPKAEYDIWWESVNKIQYFGRYIVIRFLELARHWDFMRGAIYDIRAGGEAHSLIRCLMLFRPELAEKLASADIKFVEAIASEVRDELRYDYGLDISWLNYSILLCEYRVAYEKAHEYPGRSHDEELQHLYSRHGDHWRARGLSSGLFAARAVIDPHRCLGEMNNWREPRYELSTYLRKFNTVWSDLRYDYNASIAHGRPIEWASSP